MSHHKKLICMYCGITIAQCRCIAEKTDISYSTCEACLKNTTNNPALRTGSSLTCDTNASS